MHIDKKGLWLVLTTAVISGVSIFLNAYGVKGFDSSVFTFAKNILVATLLAGLLLAVGSWRELKTLTKKQWGQLVGIGFVGGSIPFLLFFKGMQLTTGSTSGFIHKTLFVYATIAAVLLLKEKLHAGFVLGAVLLLAGTYAFLRPTFAFAAGHGIILLATVLWASENVWAKHVLKDVSGTVVAFGRMAFGSVFILGFLALTGKAGLVVSMSASQYAWIGITAALLLGFVLTFYNGLARVPVSVATSVLALGAPITAALNFAVRGVAITAWDAAGIVLTLAGLCAIVFWTQLAKKAATLFSRAQRVEE